jgi:hypothetical protein
MDHHVSCWWLSFIIAPYVPEDSGGSIHGQCDWWIHGDDTTEICFEAYFAGNFRRKAIPDYQYVAYYCERIIYDLNITAKQDVKF